MYSQRKAKDISYFVLFLDDAFKPMPDLFLKLHVLTFVPAGHITSFTASYRKPYNMEEYCPVISFVLIFRRACDNDDLNNFHNLCITCFAISSIHGTELSVTSFYLLLSMRIIKR